MEEKSLVVVEQPQNVQTDATGSRRYICLTIPKGQLIDNAGDIDYEQLYAQLLYEIRELNAPYQQRGGDPYSAAEPRLYAAEGHCRDGESLFPQAQGG